ncbi:MAG: cytochrome c family protein [Proteobacteria bacterium]|nr:cytochrome c family protein [Pseudomonadota bacterium]
MNSYELNKIGGAVLLAVLVFVGIGMIAGMVNPVPHVAVGYVVPGVEVHHDVEVAENAAPVAVPFSLYLAQGSAETGARVFNKCKQCHTIDAGGRNGTGPNLHNIVGADLGHLDSFNYSSAVREKGGVWDYDALNAWIENPRAYIPKNKMAYAGIRDAQERAHLILFLRENTDNPPALPVAEAPAAPEAEHHEDEAAPAHEPEAAPEEAAPVEAEHPAG